MTTLHHHPLSTRVRLWKAGIAAATGLAVFAHSGAALAASSWSPTLLVNTESFQTIDDGDGTTDVELRFGGALNERIFWDVETGRFEFTDDVHVQGNLTASGTLTVDGNARTKGDLFLNSDNGATDAVLTFGSDGTAETLTFANGADRFQFSDDVYIQDTLEVDGSAQFDGPSLTIGDAAGDTVTVNSNGWTFANDTNFTLSGGANGLSFDTNTLSIDAAGDRVGVGTTAPDTKLEVIGTVSGTQIHAQNFLTTSGSLQVEGAANIHGTLSGNTIEGFNLTDCDLSTQKLLWDATSKTFVCGTDDSGISQSSADARYVNTSGDTMTGGLTIANGAGLAASGSIRTESDLTINEDNGDVDAILTFGNDGGARTLRFNNTTNNFTFSDDVDVTGGLNTTLDITTDGNLEINEDNGAVNAVLTFGNASGDETITFTNATQEFDISNNTNVAGTFDATGNITTNSDMTINADNGDAAAVLTFGNDASVGSLTYTNDLNPRFSFNDDVRTTGNLSGSTLTVDGALTLRGQTYNFPTDTQANGEVLTTDGAGNLTWSSVTVPNGSGGIISMNPGYDGAIYFASGSTYIGQLTASGGMNSGFENTYQWTSSKSGIQDYWISARVRVPDNFSNWDPVKALQLRYRTKTATASQNHITVKLLDTTGAAVNLTGGASLTSTSFTTANITGPHLGGTYTPGGFITILVKVASNSSGQANAGYLTINWGTSTP
jgi:hypothetical protein